MPGSSASSACSRTSFRGRWTWPRSSAPPASRWRSAGFTSRAVWRCCRGCRPISNRARRMGITLFAGEAEGRLEGLFADALAGRLRPIYNYMDDLPGLQRQVTPFLPVGDRAPLRREPRRLRRRARLPVPVQLLHDHQRAGAQIALARRRRCRAAGARQSGPGRVPVFHHRRQFRAQPQLGGDLRPADRDARTGGAGPAIHHPGRHAVPPHPRISSRRRRAPAASGSLSGSKTSTPTICCRPRKSRTGCTNTARCSLPGGRSG